MESFQDHLSSSSLSHPDQAAWFPTDQPMSAPHDPPLQEPVPFEDFQFSFGLDPDFAIPVPFDLFPADNGSRAPEPNVDTSFRLFSPPDNLPAATPVVPSHSDILDENDQKAFSEFLDALYMDQDLQQSSTMMEPLPSHFSSLYDSHPMPRHVAPENDQTPVPSSYPTSSSMMIDDEYRRTSILQSLDQQKRFQQRLQLLASMSPRKSSFGSETHHHKESVPHAPIPQPSYASMPPPPPPTYPTSNSGYHQPPRELIHTQPALPWQEKKLKDPIPTTVDTEENKKPGKRPITDGNVGNAYSSKRNKPHKELLTEEEKRTNHIASEQKRRSTIRSGFKDLSEIVPTLKNMNNSKSMVLFKAVDYIKYLEKRNKNLRDKIGALEIRVQVEGRMPTGGGHRGYRDDLHSKMAPSIDKKDMEYHPFNNTDHSNAGHAAAVALKAHKAQQKQLLAFQEHLQQQQQKVMIRQYDPRGPVQHRPSTYFPESSERWFDGDPMFRRSSGYAHSDIKVDDASEEPLKATVSA